MLLHILTIVFITLKLCGVIAWSWWLVCLPSIAAVGIVLGLVSVVGAVLGGSKK